MGTSWKARFPLSLFLRQLLNLMDLITYPSAAKLLPQHTASSKRTQRIIITMIISVIIVITVLALLFPA